jgi:hypothetical protein
MGTTIHISFYKKELAPPQIEYIVRIYSQPNLYEKQFIEKNNMIEKRLESAVKQGKFQIVGTITPIHAVYLYDDVLCDVTPTVFFNKNPIPFICNLNEEREKCNSVFDRLDDDLQGNNCVKPTIEPEHIHMHPFLSFQNIFD